MSIAGPKRKMRKQVLQEVSEMLWDYLNALVGHVPIEKQQSPCFGNAEGGNWEHHL